jgi:threonine dehydrogenase-like Zn-dependent dehydrogenase
LSWQIEFFRASIAWTKGIDAENAAFFASAETAANLVLDTAPLLGERISVFGLGIIGLLVSGLLTRFPLTTITGWTSTNCGGKGRPSWE